jgi:hypothetical protein
VLDVAVASDTVRITVRINRPLGRKKIVDQYKYCRKTSAFEDFKIAITIQAVKSQKVVEQLCAENLRLQMTWFFLF